jgi:hypothetical protein
VSLCVAYATAISVPIFMGITGQTTFTINGNLDVAGTTKLKRQY